MSDFMPDSFDPTVDNLLATAEEFHARDMATKNTQIVALRAELAGVKSQLAGALQALRPFAVIDPKKPMTWPGFVDDLNAATTWWNRTQTAPTAAP